MVRWTWTAWVLVVVVGSAAGGLAATAVDRAGARERLARPDRQLGAVAALVRGATVRIGERASHE